MPQAISSGVAPSPLPGIDRAGAQPVEGARPQQQVEAQARTERVPEAQPSEAEQQARRAEAGDTRGQRLDVTA